MKNIYLAVVLLASVVFGKTETDNLRYLKSVQEFSKWNQGQSDSILAQNRDYLLKKDDFWKVRILLKEAQSLYSKSDLDRKKAYGLLKKASGKKSSVYTRRLKQIRDSLGLFMGVEYKDSKLLKGSLIRLSKRPYFKISDETWGQILTELQRSMVWGNCSPLMELSLWQDKFDRTEELFKSCSAPKNENQLRTFTSYKARYFKGTKQSSKIPELWKSYKATTKKNKIYKAKALYLTYKKTQPVKANFWLKKLEKLKPGYRKVVQVPWIRSFELEQEEKYDQALVQYDRVSSNIHSEYRWEAYLRRGIVYLKKKEYKKAVAAFSLRSKSFPLKIASPMRYFKGFSELEAKDTTAAIKSWNDLLSDHPLGYYSWRARERLEEVCLKQKCAVSYPQQYNANDSVVFSWLKVKDNKSLKRKLKIIDGDLKTAKILIDLGDQSLCDDWLNYKIPSKSKNKAQLFYAAKSLADLDELGLGYRYARRLLGALARGRMDSIPAPVARVIYPAGWSEKVEKYSKQYGVPASFIYSIMRQESAFDANAESHVGAKGLLQLMPATGKRVASWVGEKLNSPEELFNPDLNIKLGVKYMQVLFENWKGNIVLVASEYNAGPRPANRWKKLFKKYPFDVAIESISYGETRHYVKRVQGNLKNFTNFNPHLKELKKAPVEGQ
ncbi:transglycosylase SLT domain-containing protein [Fibrobacterales bacterium]|nr:transglycosylase SLT domain-containing protein [Fibrobacterales bacterium]